MPRVPFALAAVFVLAYAAWAGRSPDAGLRLYAIDCGRIRVSDMSVFADTGELDGRPAAVIAPCYLIRHPQGTLLWDTGLSDALVGKGPVRDGIFEVSVERRLIDQLKAVGLAPSDVTWLAFSHLHFDHTGNANAFPAATWILDKHEIEWATSNPAPLGVDQGSFSAHKDAKTKLIDGDYDVFGDGTVQILKTPGHTPGHGVLAVKLKKAGVVVLSGDLYHLRENRKFKRVPRLNVSRADTLASFDRVERIVKNARARFVVQHDVADFDVLPRFPAYLE